MEERLTVDDKLILINETQTTEVEWELIKNEPYDTICDYWYSCIKVLEFRYDEGKCLNKKIEKLIKYAKIDNCIIDYNFKDIIINSGVIWGIVNEN